MSEEKTQCETEPKASAPQHKQNFDEDRQALRRLIDTLGNQRSGDDSGFYRNVGRFIARPMMKPD